MLSLLVNVALAAPHAYDCTQTTLIDANLMQRLELVVNGGDHPAAARVTTRNSGAVEAEGRTQPRPGYDGGYWMQNYGLESWLIGWSADGDKYMLLVPQAPLGTQFDAQVHTLFQGGAQGGMQNEFHCVRI